MRYFIDTEYIFTTDKRGGTIEPVSIGIVAEDGREFYRVSTNFNPRHASQWVRENVLSLLPVRRPSAYDSPRLWHESQAWQPLKQIAADLQAFIGDDVPEFWGDYADFDYVALSIIMGGFDNWPDGWPMYVNDLQQEAIPEAPSKVPHNALADARAVRDAFNWSRQGTP